MAYLRLLDLCEHELGQFDVLAVAAGKSRNVIAEERDDITLPRIGLKLHPVWRPGDVIDAGPELGRQVSVTIDVIWRGRRVSITGVPTVLEDPLGLVLPRGLLA